MENENSGNTAAANLLKKVVSDHYVDRLHQKALVYTRKTRQGENMNLESMQEVTIATTSPVLIEVSEEVEEASELFEESSIPQTGSELVLRLDEREQNPYDFIRMHGLTAMINLFNEVGEEICNPGGRVLKGTDEYLAGWYQQASRAIRNTYFPNPSSNQSS